MSPVKFILALAALLPMMGCFNTSKTTTSAVTYTPERPLKRRVSVCSVVNTYPRPATEKLSFESGEVSPLCQPFISKTRSQLDHCGNEDQDPYTSSFTWPSPNEMKRKGNINIIKDPGGQALYKQLMERIENIRDKVSPICCGDDLQCQKAIQNVEVSVCTPTVGGDQPDRCVFGGVFRMQAQNYTRIFSSLYKLYSTADTAALREIAARNLGSDIIKTLQNPGEDQAFQLTDETYPISGKIILTSYVPRKRGVSALDPVIHHEFGHACSMVRMQLAASSGQEVMKFPKAMRALQWLDSVKSRCSPSAPLPEAYHDFWESVGESAEFSACLFKLTALNQNQKVDSACPDLCPGHYLEESVGVAFSMLTGDLSGKVGSTFPNTCNHIRDGQHPMVNDVVECLAQHSPRFRARLRASHSCVI